MPRKSAVKPKANIGDIISTKVKLIMNPKDAYDVFGDNWRTIVVNGVVLSIDKKQKNLNGPFQSYFTADFDLGEGITHRGDVRCGQIQLVRRGDNLQPAISDDFPMVMPAGFNDLVDASCEALITSKDDDD
jgi:hypothetical protein